MSGRNSEVIEVKGLDSKEIVYSSSCAEVLVDCDREYRYADIFVRLFQQFWIVPDLVYGPRSGWHVNVLNDFVLTGLLAASKVKISEERIRIAAVMAKNDSGPSDISCFFDLPEADVLFAAGNKTRIVDRTELHALNVEFRSLFNKNLRFDSLGANFRNVPN